jgi:hypothetical protein
MDEHLTTINYIIDEYESGTYLTTERLLELLRQLSGAMYHLTVINTNAGVKHNGIQYRFDGSVAKGIVEAEQQVPELRMTRKILDTCNRVHSSMIMELSILKKEI